MTIYGFRKILGAIMVFIPFAAFIAAMSWVAGPLLTLGILAAACLAVGLVIGGTLLLNW